MRKTRRWQMPSIAQGAVGYLVALLLALSFRHVVLGKDRTASHHCIVKLTQHSQKATTHTSAKPS
jgi:hypothetical protein